MQTVSESIGCRKLQLRDAFNYVVRDGKPKVYEEDGRISLSVSEDKRRYGVWLSYDGPAFERRIASDLQMACQSLNGCSLIGLLSSRANIPLLLDMEELLARAMAVKDFDACRWWDSWKDFLGNASKRDQISNVFAELLAMSMLLRKGYHRVAWDGPAASACDISAEEGFFEVKSTLSQSTRLIHIHNKNQSRPGVGMIFIALELLGGAQSLTIANLLELIEEDDSALAEYIRNRLTELGFDGPSFTVPFVVHEVLLYQVTEAWPKVDPESLPPGVIVESYCLDLDLAGLQYEEDWTADFRQFYF